MTSQGRERIAIVTGAGSGLGRAIAEELATRGISVLVTSRDEHRLEAVVRAIEATGARAFPFLGDLSRGGGLEKLIRFIAAAAAAPYALVNNAASVAPVGPLGSVELDDIEMNLRLNLFVPIALCRCVIPLMAADGGRIVNVTSSAAERPYAGLSSYSAAKAGLEQFTRSCASELPRNVSVCALRPGLIDTAMQEDLRSRSPSELPAAKEFGVLRRLGALRPPGEAARVIAHLLMDATERNGEVLDLADPAIAALASGG